MFCPKAVQISLYAVAQVRVQTPKIDYQTQGIRHQTLDEAFGPCPFAFSLIFCEARSNVHELSDTHTSFTLGGGELEPY